MLKTQTLSDADYVEVAIPPPTVKISREIRNSPDVHEAYSNALKQHGAVIIVPRHGREEYIVDHRHAYEVLTDSKNFTFDKAAFQLLHLSLMELLNASYVNDIDSLVQTGVQPRLSGIVDRIVPIFQARFDSFAANVGSERKVVEVENGFQVLQTTIAHAMVVMILGPEYSSSEMANHFSAITMALAQMTGMNENVDGWEWAPMIWSLMTTFAMVCFVLIPRFFFGIVPRLWRNRRRHHENGQAKSGREFVPVFDCCMAKYYGDKSGLAAFGAFCWCATLSLGIIFASVHQTATAAFWLVLTLSRKQGEYLPKIRAEWNAAIAANGGLDVKALNQLTHLDSFIRETLRTKGDTWAPIRYSTKPVKVGPYVLPKDAFCMPFVPDAHTHADNYGSRGKVFEGFQWQKKQKPAVQGSKDFLAFGLGRWACPGRALAVHELKIIVYMFFSHFDVHLKDDAVRVTNWINTTSVPPEATLLVKLRK